MGFALPFTHNLVWMGDHLDRLTGCWTAAMTLPTHGGSTRSMTSFNWCALSQRPRLLDKK